MEKGKAIRFVKGKYEGLNGWIDKSKRSKKKGYQHVIVELDADPDDENLMGEPELKATYVKITSLRKQFSSEPRTFEEAALRQHKDIEKAMIDLADMFAKLGGNVNNNEVMRLFTAELNTAQELQHKLGSKARYRYVNFKI
jgi:hypothetical protein